MFSVEERSFLQRELDRVEGRLMPFGAWRGVHLEMVPREQVNRPWRLAIRKEQDIP
jgi:hypothetical protein